MAIQPTGGVEDVSITEKLKTVGLIDRAMIWVILLWGTLSIVAIVTGDPELFQRHGFIILVFGVLALALSGGLPDRSDFKIRLDEQGLQFGYLSRLCRLHATIYRELKDGKTPQNDLVDRVCESLEAAASDLDEVERLSKEEAQEQEELITIARRVLGRRKRVIELGLVCLGTIQSGYGDLILGSL